MLTGLKLWSGEGDNGEIESKDGFYKHHGVRGRSDWSRWIEESGKTTVMKKGEKSRCFIL
jgi:hypothetical protein